MRSILLQVFFLVTIHPVRGGEISLVNAGNSKYVVTINAGADPQEEKAANLFRQYVKQATGINLPITTSHSFDNRIDFTEDASLPDGSFSIKNIGNNLLISGGKDRGVINGSVYLLNRYFGVGFLSAGNVSVPVIKNVVVKTPLSIRQEPSFQMRTIHSIEGYYQDYVETHALQFPFIESAAFPSNFNADFMPPAQYYKAHPEYYSLRAGKRDTAQPDLLQPAIAALIKQKVNNAIRQRTGTRPVYYNLFLNDNPLISEDAKTQQAISGQGNYSALYLDFVNNIAAGFPQQKFLALAYEQTKDVPLRIAPGKNVNMVLTNADTDKSKPLQQDDYDVQQHLHMKTLLPQWLAKDPNLIYWDYLANYNNSLMPWPNLYTIKPNLKYYKSVGVKNLLLQLGGLFSSESSELKNYLCASLLWNTEYDDDSLIQDFCMKFYEASGQLMYQYFAEMNKQALLGKETMYTYDSPVKFSKSLFSFNNIKKWQHMLLNTEKGAKSVAVKKRIMKERLGLDCVYIELSVKVPGWNSVDGKAALNRKIDGFQKDMDYLKLTRISDGKQNIQEFTNKLKQQNL